MKRGSTVDANDYITRAFEIDVSEDYKTTHGRIQVTGTGLKSELGIFHVTPKTLTGDDSRNFDSDDPRFGAWVGEFIGISDKFQIIYIMREYSSAAIKVIVKSNLKDEALKKWKIKVWNKIKDAAYLIYQENITSLQQRLNELYEELGSDDPLTLRKKEREEIMKYVLLWFLGPQNFTELRNMYDNSTGSVNPDFWQKILYRGEFIKFLHNAIEWENMIYFLYPYYWGSPENWELKKNIHHPDFLHRSFLRAGRARVVLTIRPGFEKEFISVLSEGAWNPGNAPYVLIAEEMQNYARINYPGVPSLISPLDEDNAAVDKKGKKLFNCNPYMNALRFEYLRQIYYMIFSNKLQQCIMFIPVVQLSTIQRIFNHGLKVQILHFRTIFAECLSLLSLW